MSYNTRSKNDEPAEPQSEIGDEPTTKENLIAADIPSALQPDQSNSSKEDKTILTNQNKCILVSRITVECINHSLDLFNQNIREDVRQFNTNTIFKLDMGSKIKSNKTKNEYCVICKIGYGGFSVVWLVIDMKTKEIKVAKVFKYGNRITMLEVNTLERTITDPHILRFYEYFVLHYGARDAFVAIYEPMGKNLNTLVKEHAKRGGLPISIVKKIAKHILMALKTLHDLKVVHSDIKLDNIAPRVSQVSLRQEFGKMVRFMKSGKILPLLRMVCDTSKFDVNKNGKLLEKEFAEVSKLELKDETELIFKLIDFGNVMKEGRESPTGTYGFRPPEYCFGATLLQSHDIWSLGVTIVVILTNKTFLKFAFSEIGSLRKMFGKFSRSHFKDFKDPRGYMKKYTTKKYNSEKAEKQIKKLLQNKFKKLQMHEDDREELIDFLIQMFNTVPSQRKSTDELLSHPWLNGVMEYGEYRSEEKLNSEDGHNETNSNETHDTEDSDSDETEEDSNETISDFSSDDESYVEGDASHGPPFENFSGDEALDGSFSS